MEYLFYLHVGFDEDWYTDELFTRNVVQVKYYELEEFEEFGLEKKRNHMHFLFDNHFVKDYILLI